MSKVRVSINHPSEDWCYQMSITPTFTGREMIENLIAANFIRPAEYRLGITKKRNLHILDLSKPLLDQGIDNRSVISVLPEQKQIPLSAMFLGPKAENADIWVEAINSVLSDYIYWRKNYFPNDPVALGVADINENERYFDEFRVELQTVLNELKAGFPFHSPRYLGHMLSGQTLPSVIGYFAGILYNPNNVTDEAAPVTVAKEIEYGKMICHMLGYSKNSWAHICSGGTIANLEALWVARFTQFLPLCIKDLCYKKRLEFRIKVPGKSDGDGGMTQANRVPIVSLKIKQLLSLRPNESLFMVSNLVKYLVEEKGFDAENAAAIVNDGINESKYNIRKRGFAQVLQEVNLKPVLFIPESAHYSFKKAANVLGYGENAIRPIPVTSKFRIDTEKLKNMINDMNDDEYIAAVVAVVGTTEEGAVDPVHEIKWMRNTLSAEKGISFWLHVDAAWGGFARSLFCDEFNTENADEMLNKEDAYGSVGFDDKVTQMIERINATEYFFAPASKRNKKRVMLAWKNEEVYKAYMAIRSADSITVDPHKLGYVPYPAGVVAFKNKLVTSLVAQNATYISTAESTIANAGDNEITGVGSYILEGSKPGAAALACWLSAKLIPLDMHHHGKIIRTTMLNAQRIAHYLRIYETRMFKPIDQYFVDRGVFSEESRRPFTFRLLYDNIDTNVVCFAVVPTRWRRDDRKGDRMESERWSLRKTNHLNNLIYQKFTINPSTKESDRKETLAQRYFVSKTILTKDSYAFESIRDVLAKFDFSKGEYEKEGLFVMRMTVMNPWYYLSQFNEVGKAKDYFLELIYELHYQSRKAVETLDATPDNF